MKALLIGMLLMVSGSAMASQDGKLCQEQSMKMIKNYFADDWVADLLGSYTIDREDVQNYYVGENGLDEQIVQYAYFLKTDAGRRYIRLTMTKKGCKSLITNIANSRRAMEADDLDAAQGGVSED